MASPSRFSSAVSHAPSHDYEAIDLTTLFAQGFDFQTTDRDMINKYAIHKLNQYAAANAEDFSLWNCIQVDFEKFEARHFDEFDSATWRVIRDYCYPHGYWIDNNFGPYKTTRTTAMLKAVAADWDNKWTLEQIEWVEERYDTVSRTTRKRRQELTGIPNLDSPSNFGPNRATSRGLSIEPQTQQFQDVRFQTPSQQPTMQPLYPALSKPSPYVYQPHQLQRAPKHPPPPQFLQQHSAYMHQSTYGYQPAQGHQSTYGPQHAYENQYWPNEYQPVPNYYQLVPNYYQLVPSTHQPVPNGPTSKIRDNCECIPKPLTARTSPVPLAPALPIQAPPAEEIFPAHVLSVQVPLVQASPAQAPPVQAILIQAPPAKLSPAQVPSAQASPVQALPIQAPPAQAPPVQAISIQAPPAGVSPAQAPPIDALPASALSATNEPQVNKPQLDIRNQYGYSKELIMLDSIQRGMDPAYHGTLHICENVIQVYTSGLVNHLVNYEAVHKSMQRSHLYENEDYKLYFTDCQYRKGGFKLASIRPFL